MSQFYRSEDERVIQKQAEIIARQNEDIRQFCDEIKKMRKLLDTYEDGGRFWIAMQEQIKENPTLQGEWLRFTSFLKLAISEEEFAARVWKAT